MIFSIDESFLLERNENVVTRLISDDPRDMAAPGGVFGEHDVARTETTYRAVAGFDLDLAGKSDDVLAFRRGVIIA